MLSVYTQSAVSELAGVRLPPFIYNVLSLSLYIYIYIYNYVCIYIYIYIVIILLVIIIIYAVSYNNIIQYNVI